MVWFALTLKKKLYIAKMEKIPIYFVPGLAASTSIFEYLELPEEKFEIHLLDWLIPISKHESIKDYAARMCERIEHKNPVLVGVSFGGIIVQEMSKIIKTRKTIIISSVKSRNEFPKRLKIAKATRAYKLFPTSIVSNLEGFSKYAIGDTAKKRLDLYKKYFSMRDKTYLPWAVYNVLNWEQTDPDKEVIHIHGKNDNVFPLKYIKNCTVIDGGTHIMILNKAKKISTILMEVI